MRTVHVFGKLHSERHNNPYQRSKLADRTLQTRVISVVDLDGTLAAGSIEARRDVVKLMRRKGALIYSTARTPELVMSTHTYELSRYAKTFQRPRPKWRINAETGIYEFVPLEKEDEFECVLDPDAILSLGEGILLQQDWCTKTKVSHYVADRAYEEKFLDPAFYTGGKKRRWKEDALDLIRLIGAERYLAAIESEDSYAHGRANVASPRYRIQLDLRGSDAIEKKYQLMLELMAAAKGSPVDGLIEPVDESRPNDHNPDEHRATLYVMPPTARKEHMLSRMYREVCTVARLETNENKINIFGDTLTDFYQICYGGWDADVTGVLVGDRLVKAIEEKTAFAGVDLRRMSNALKPTGREGVYYFDNPLMRGGWIKRGKRRKIIIGRQAYPGTDGADTIWAYLNDKTMHALRPPRLR